MKGSQAVRKGWSAYQQGDISLAEAEFSKALQENPEAAFPSLQRGLFLLRQDRFSEAAQSFQLAAEKETSNPAPLFFLTVARELEDEEGLATAALEKLEQLCPRHQGLASLRLLKQLRRGNPLPTLELLGYGDQSSRGGGWRPLVAGLGLGDPSWMPPDLSSSPYLMGPILVEIEKRLLPREIPELHHPQGELPDNFEDLQRPKRSFSEEVRGLGQSWKAAGNLRRGRQKLERSMGIEKLEEQQAELAEAIRLLSAGHSADPFSFRTNYHLGEAYLFSAKTTPGTPYAQEPLRQAERHFVESVRMDGVNPYVLFYLALIQQLLGRPEPALRCYRKATEKFTKLPEAHYGMGQCLLLLDRPAEARELLLRAVNSDLALAKERLNLFANLLRQEGPEAFSKPLPRLPERPSAPLETSSEAPAAETEAAATPGELASPLEEGANQPEGETAENGKSVETRAD